MKKVLLILAVFGLAGLGYYLYSNHYYYKVVNAPEINSGSELTTETLVNLQNYLDYRNLTKDFPVYPNEHESVAVGTFNDLLIEELYWCSDLCPDNGILYLNFASSTKESCESLGGTNFISGDGVVNILVAVQLKTSFLTRSTSHSHITSKYC
jgi:hypothetical protein